MKPELGFALFFALTLICLGIVVASGLKARMRVHIPAVIGALASLGTAVYFALKLGHVYDLEAAGLITPVHLTLAKLATALYVLPLVTGVMTYLDRSKKRLHFRVAMLVLVLTVLAAVTGTWMILAAPRL
jgi:hypothetical protein